MAKRIEPGTYEDERRIERAIADLRVCRDELKLAGAPMAAKAVARAIKSAEGALRYVSRRIRATENNGVHPWNTVEVCND